MSSQETKQAQAAIDFDRMEGLPESEHRPYNMVVSGRGRLLAAEIEQRRRAADIDESPFSVTPLEGSYLAGLVVLSALGLAPAEPQGDEQPEKPSFILLRTPTSHTLTFIFSGNNAEFALPSHLLLAQDTHILIVRDPRRCFGLAGIPGLGRDYAACIASMKRIIEGLGGPDVRVLGISAGGAGAIKFSCDLAASRLLCFSSPTTLNLDDDPGAELRNYPQLALLYRRDRSLGIDLAAYFAAHATRPEAIMIFSEGHIRDSWLAGRMADIPGVRLLPVKDFDGHTAYKWLSQQKTVGEYLDLLYDKKKPDDALSAAPTLPTTVQTDSPDAGAKPRSGLLQRFLRGRGSPAD